MVIIILIFSILIFVLIFVSYSKFHVLNPISSGIGLMRINTTDTNFVEIQNSPRVVLAKPNNAWSVFLNALENEGYKYLEDERMGSLCVFEKNGVIERVNFSINQYYSIWIWET